MISKAYQATGTHFIFLFLFSIPFITYVFLIHNIKDDRDEYDDEHDSDD